MRRTLSIAVSAFLAAGSAFAGGAGSTGAPFLKVPINGRAVGMAGAFTAVNGDLTAMEYNPAGLGGLRRADIALTYIDYLQDTSFQSAGFASPIGPAATDSPDEFHPGRPVVGFQFRQFSADDEARNELGVKTGSISVRDQLFHLDLAVPVTRALSIGAGAKYVSRTLDDATATGVSADAGLVWRAPSNVTVGASVLNVGPSTKFIDVKEPTPMLVRLGAARPFGPVLVALDATQGRDSVTRLGGGAEWSLGKYVKLRGGAFQQTSDLGFSAGLGVLLPGPMKAPPSSRRRGASPLTTKRAPATNNELVFNERRAADLLDRLNALSSDLTDRFQRSGYRPADNPLIVLPAAGAGARMATALADLLGQQLQQNFPIVDGGRVEAAIRDLGLPDSMDDDQAARLAQMLNAKAVVIQQFTTGRDAHALHDRIVLASNGNAVAAASTSFPADVFRGGRLTLSQQKDEPRPSASAETFDRVDWGLDYGLTSRSDLGLSHTITLRILY